MTDLAPNLTEIGEFLIALHPDGPWSLFAFYLERNRRPTEAGTFDTIGDAIQFASLWNTRGYGVYFSVNALRPGVNKKASKAEIERVSFLHVDADPADDETSEAFKARALPEFEAHNPEASLVWDSGNGLQALWRLTPPGLIVNGTGVISVVESRNIALAASLKAPRGTQNIDRVLRLPGTVNWPDAHKRSLGRVPVMSRLLRVTDAVHDLGTFPPAAETKKPYTKPNHNGEVSNTTDEDELTRTIRDGGEDRHGESRSEAVWWVVNEMIRRGYQDHKIRAVILDRDNGISAHVYDQADPDDYTTRQVENAKAKIEYICITDKKGREEPVACPENINIALAKYGIGVRYDQFADQVLIDGLADFGPLLEDPAMNRLWMQLPRWCKLSVTERMLETTLKDNARINAFHPVLDYLADLEWDGTHRVRHWLHKYSGAADDKYTQMVGILMLIAAVRRVRQPGAKFDEMVVLRSDQGTNKSSALAVMAVREDWFSDDMPLQADPRRVIESVRGKWIVETAELSGLKRGDINAIKAFLSRTHDRARLVWDKLTSQKPRQCIFVGTTNDPEYLKDLTGNRRFWPVTVVGFDLEALERDRDQLWAEAAALEALGASIRLPEKLWPIAAIEQAKVTTQDPYRDVLQDHLGNKEGKISSESIWTILDMRAGQRGQEQSRRISDAMRSLGWDRANNARTVKIAGKMVVGWVKGEQPWRPWQAYREQGECRIVDIDDQRFPAQWDVSEDENED
jgi:hypothetical protein